MAYVNNLKASPYYIYLPDDLKDHLNGEELKDHSVDYKELDIENDYVKRKKREVFRTKPSDVRLPARLSSPLIPYPREIKSFISGNDEKPCEKIHSHHASQLSALISMKQKLVELKLIPDRAMRYNMDDLKKFARQNYSIREDLINLATLSFAQRATMHDLSIAAGTKVDFKISPAKTSTYTSFIIMVQRLRLHMAKENNFKSATSEIKLNTSDEAAYTMFDNGVYIYQSKNPGRQFTILSCGGHFQMYHENLDYWFAGPMSYFDYIFTVSDILNNLDVIKNCNEYAWGEEMFSLMIKFTEHEGHHNNQVNFMKGLEGFLLNMSDYDEEYAMNWKPILEAAHDLWELDKQIIGQSYDFGIVMTLLRGHNYKYPVRSFLCRIIQAGKRLSRTHLQEVSALHKLIFYAEVDAQAGVRKFLKRVHTPRKIEKSAIRNLTRFAKMSFLLSYRNKHKTLPDIIGPPAKVKILESYTQRGDKGLVESLPLSWWDEVKIYDCMDNTLTDDPLEFAKDKGALKPEISFGPGDSRKELLQVIERKKYTLNDFFKGRTLVKKAKRITRTNQRSEPVKMRDAARLIEKEREQKIEARLFGNAGLDNKHSLSLVATKMKKALSYFDEQLMTPPDQKRKQMIHEASRKLAQRDNYSLLLDIEGHNQSMQYENTSELCEFIGNLFGYDDWGDLPNYFSGLTVYHYDEYLDEVMTSEGQLGGIEGWLNPLWTLHTTLMLKLLRVMTDLDVRTIMVYSDDVNAIMSIPQASEAMVKSVFDKIMSHCTKFGMTIKYSQTTLSKHRITMLRQHYADGVRADSTLKRLISVSAGNNSVLVSEELEVSGICSSASSALELSNHHEACSYLKNYKLGLLISRLPQMILSRPDSSSMISSEELPAGLSNLLYYTKDDKNSLDILSNPDLMHGAKNDIAAYLGRRPGQMNQTLLKEALAGVYGQSVAEMKLVDSPDRVLYLQIYDKFLQDLMFYWLYTPCSIGGLGGSLHINLVLSGHSSGFSKSLHYLFQWILNYSDSASYFTRYLTVALSIDEKIERNMDESRLVSSTWQNDTRICPATTSVRQSIKSMIRRKTKNESILEMFDLSDKKDQLAKEYLEIFRDNFHTRIVQFYHENTSTHFLDLLIGKIETSSGLLTQIRDINKLRRGLSFRTIENIRMSANTGRTLYLELTEKSDIIAELLRRKLTMYPKVKMIEVEEILYDDKIKEVDMLTCLLTVRRCSPMHYRNGIKVYDDPKVGNETLYKGELIDDDRLLGNKEELLAAKLVAVTKWFLMKYNLMTTRREELLKIDCIVACNLSLLTLTGQTFEDLVFYAPTETGGEILHRIPNMRFSTSTYIRSEMNRSLSYTTDLNQSLITRLGMVDSNVNFDYLRMRFLVAAIVKDKYDDLRRLVTRYSFSRLTGIKDVQFVEPKFTSHMVTSKPNCYAKMRGHDMSVMRFRYLSHAYMYEEEMKDWAVLPKVSELKSSETLGEEYINDIILRYAKNLDKDYMLVSHKVIDENLWMPLIRKLKHLNIKWASENTNNLLIEIRDRLCTTLTSRSRVTLVEKSNKIHISLQSACIEGVLDRRPTDNEYDLISRKFASVMQNRRHSRNLSMRLAKYQALLESYAFHRNNLARTLLMEYILTFHFKVKHTGNRVEVDIDGAIEEFKDNPVGTLSHVLIAPDLTVKLLVLGMEFVSAVSINSIESIKTELEEICDEVTLDDILLPSAIPSTDPFTTLTGREEIPQECFEADYSGVTIPYSAMRSLDEIMPLSKYAHKCSTSGAAPSIFTSFTGSDSLAAQIGLFRYLLNEEIVDESMKICDLTAGRGDGLYALRALNCNVDSYALPDTFTKVNHHPDLIYKSDYDIFRGETLKFVTAYDFVHIDLSFTGKTDSNLLDVILFLEENNLSYSIRINSAICAGYDEERTRLLSPYKHKLCYAVNHFTKPYQIYLVGFPSEEPVHWDGPSLKESIAFKSIALSYSRLLAPSAMQLRLQSFLPNSASMCFSSRSAQKEFLVNVCQASISNEQAYYCERYISEVGEDAKIPIVKQCLPKDGKALITERRRMFHPCGPMNFNGAAEQHMGHVSKASEPFHLKHINALQDHESYVECIRMVDCDPELLHYFRTRHPLKEIRSWANIMIGMLDFCRPAVNSGWNAVNELYSELKSSGEPRLSLHQRELQFALKLLILAAEHDDYAYGVSYCHSLSSLSTTSNVSNIRILRTYRLLSYLFSDAKDLLSTGRITIRHINSIHSELEIRERKKYKYKQPKDTDIQPTVDYSDVQEMILGSMDDLFKGLERYTQSVLDESAEINAPIEPGALVASLDLTFDIGIEDHVNAAIERLGLKPSGPGGFIDLGPDDMYEGDDW
nr:RNA-dependent RNA polymerase [Erysiphe necator associated negative-stranded RNA virus 12]